MTTSPSRAPRFPPGFRRLGTVFTPPESASDSYGSLQNVGLRLQVALAVAAIATIWWAPGLASSERLQVTGLLGLFGAYTVVTAKASLHSPLIRLVSFATDLLALFVFAFAVPATFPAVLFAAILTITFHTYTCGRSAGVLLSGAVIALAVAVQVTAPPQHRLAWFTLVFYGLILGVATLMVDGLASGRRREARHLARLHRALRSVAPAPDLETTLKSVSEAVREAVDALFVVVMMSDDTQGFGVPIADGIDHDPAASTDLRRRARDPDTSPSGVALASGRPVVIADITRDDRFSHWSQEAVRFGFRGMVVVPLDVAGEPVGVLNTYLSPGHTLYDEDVDLIVAYAQQASLVIARALAYEQQRSAATRLEEADALKSEFVSTVSHELRTPLTAVRGFVGTLLAKWDDIGDEERRFLLERVDWNARELGDLIESVLDFSRLEAGDIPEESAEVDVAERLDELVYRLEPVLGGPRLTATIQGGLRVRGAVAFDRIVTNLLTNAAKFSPPGSPIEVDAYESDGQVMLSVRDHGPGISPEDRERVFERFYRAAPTAGKRGTGIGLAIVSSYVERLGGRVWVESPPGHGATFRVALPAIASVTEEVETAFSRE